MRRCIICDRAVVAERAAHYAGGLLRGGGRIVFGGGRTPGPLYAQLAEMSLPWSDIDIVPSDERCLPKSDVERNDTMILTYFGRRGCRLHCFPAELGPEESARLMENVLAKLIPFDLCILGLGEDGHTASLFPGNPALEARTLAAPVHDAPKFPPERVTLSCRAFLYAKNIIFFALGEAKREAVQRLLRGDDIPASRVCGEETILFTDVPDLVMGPEKRYVLE